MRTRLPILLAVLSFGTCLNFVGIALALNGVSGQANAGQMARDRQCSIYPASLKVYQDAQHRNIITPAELAKFQSTAERVCKSSRRSAR